MELLMMRAGIREEETTNISRFQSGLNLEIRDKVELLPYRDLNELVQLCSRVKHQIKRKTFRKDFTSSYSKSFKKEGHSSQPYSKEEKRKRKRKFISQSTFQRIKSCEIKCFKCIGIGHIASQCPTKKTMILKAQDHYSSFDEATSSSSSSEDEAIDFEEEILPCERDLLLVRRLLSNQSSEIDQSQRENIFHTKCKVLENTCSLIVDSGSTSNCCSTILVDKLTLTTKPHPKPYKMQWINEKRGIVVSQQANITISIGKYKEVLCDIVPLEASRVLLGRPWQFDKKKIHDGLTNKISFQYLGKKFVWFPLSPFQVNEDQLKLKALKDEEEKSKKKKKKKKKKERVFLLEGRKG
uniref:CCHC-type domain-containing protein n=1 Tax=Cajanus cajan TaxID=3821 RepID=A0A151TBA1_CAJCA|nr:hypothetical protein KK1_018923 [Cajanus cajan]